MIVSSKWCGYRILQRVISYLACAESKHPATSIISTVKARNKSHIHAWNIYWGMQPYKNFMRDTPEENIESITKHWRVLLQKDGDMVYFRRTCLDLHFFHPHKWIAIYYWRLPCWSRTGESLKGHSTIKSPNCWLNSWSHYANFATLTSLRTYLCTFPWHVLKT